MQAVVFLYLGEAYQVDSISTSGIERSLLENAGWNTIGKKDQSLSLESIRQLQSNLLDYLEDNGYPFAKLRMDSLRFVDKKLFGRLILEKGPFYKIDSIRIYGNVKIANAFVQRYLDIRNGSFFPEK